MKLTAKGRYAVTAMADLALYAGDGPVPLADIAERQVISLSYLEQLFAKMRRHGLVTSARGPGGGYRLARDAGDIRVSDVIYAVDEPITATRCAPGSPRGCRGTSARCLTHDLWDELGRQIHIFLSSVTLEDVAGRGVLGASRLAAEPAAADYPPAHQSAEGGGRGMDQPAVASPER